MTAEQPLAGGMYDDGRVVRVGDTVRRPIRASSVAVQALLVHLERVGFDAAPRFLGVDDHGREILSYVEGDVPLPPYPAWAMTDRAIGGLGRLLRRFHEASASFDATEVAGWSTEWSDPRGGPFVCHNDLFPENVVFREEVPIALIDFGEASPGRPTWDLAIAAEVWAPLSEPAGRLGHQAGLDAVRRVGLLAGGYGFEASRAAELVDVFAEQRAHSQAHMRAEIATGDAILREYRDAHGGDAQAAADDAWLRNQRAALIDAIANPPQT
jgi:aminoglycoside phosphotransferase (APT) family kinase protein